MGSRPLIDFKKESFSLDSGVPIEGEGALESENQNEDKVEGFKREYAGRLGWTPKDEWEKRGQDVSKWHDYDHFLAATPEYVKKVRKVNKELKTTVDRNAAAAAAMIEEERQRSRDEAIREAREAAAAGDADKAAEAVRKATSAPPPEVDNWLKRNAWFAQEPEARALAQGVTERAYKAGASVSEQLKAAEDSVRKRFPELFENESLDDLSDFIDKQPKEEVEMVAKPPAIEEEHLEPQREVRMSDSKIVASAVYAPGMNSARTRSSSTGKVKGFSDIPAEAQASYEKYFAKNFVSRGLTVEEARNKYAKTYWINRGDS